MYERDKEDKIPKLDWDYSDEVQLEILRDMLSRLPNELDRSVGSFSFDMLSPVSIELARLIAKEKEIKNKLSLKNETGDELEQRIRELTGVIIRKPATYASGVVTIVGQPGTKIEKGTLVSTDSIRFEVVNDAEVESSGEVDVIVECKEKGSIGNVSSGMIRYFPVTIQGLESVTNKEDFINGYDRETDESLYERYEEYIRTPTTSGNKYHYMQWAKEVDGVGSVKVQGADEVGPGNVRVVIIDRNQGVASEELINATKDYIETQRPIGANVTVDTGFPKNISITADVRLADRHTIQNVTKEFTKRLEEYRKDIAFKETYVSFAKINQILLSTDGVLDLENLLVDGDTNNISLDSEEIPIFKEPELKPIKRGGF